MPDTRRVGERCPDEPEQVWALPAGQLLPMGRKRLITLSNGDKGSAGKEQVLGEAIRRRPGLGSLRDLHRSCPPQEGQ